MNGKRVWDLHPGDALAEGQYRTGLNALDGNRQLGVETDGYGRPIGYYFRNMGRLSPLNVEYSSFGNQRRTGCSVQCEPGAAHPQTGAARSRQFAAGRAAVQVIEDIARLDEWYSALVRSATLRASIGILLERDGTLGMADALGAPGAGGIAATLDCRRGSQHHRAGTACRALPGIRGERRIGHRTRCRVQASQHPAGRADIAGGRGDRHARAPRLRRSPHHTGHVARRLQGAVVLRRPARAPPGERGDQGPADDAGRPVLHADLGAIGS